MSVDLKSKCRSIFNDAAEDLTLRDVTVGFTAASTAVTAAILMANPVGLLLYPLIGVALHAILGEENDALNLEQNHDDQSYEQNMSIDWDYSLDGEQASYRFGQYEHLCFSQDEMSGMLAEKGIEHKIEQLTRDDGANLGLSIIVNGSENIEKLESMFQDSSYHAEFLERRERIDYSSFFEKAGVLGEPTYKTNLNKAMGMPVIGKPS